MSRWEKPRGESLADALAAIIMERGETGGVVREERVFQVRHDILASNRRHAVARTARTDEVSSWSIQLGKEDMLIRCHPSRMVVQVVVCAVQEENRLTNCRNRGCFLKHEGSECGQ